MCNATIDDGKLDLIKLLKGNLFFKKCFELFHLIPVADLGVDVTGRDICRCVHSGSILSFKEAIKGISLDSRAAKDVAITALIDKGDSSDIMMNLIISGFAVKFTEGELAFFFQDFCVPGLSPAEAEVI